MLVYDPLLIDLTKDVRLLVHNTEAKLMVAMENPTIATIAKESQI